MKISYRAVYTLLGKYYQQRSLTTFIAQDVDLDILNASILFAKKEQNYEYLDTIQKREDLDKKFVLFTNGKAEYPIILEKEKDLTILELALLCKNSVIHVDECKHLIESAADNLGINEQDIVSRFKMIVTQVKPAVKAEKK